MKIFYFIAGIALALAPNTYLAWTLPHWPEPWEDRTAMANTYVQMKKTDEAIVQLQEVVKLHPGTVQYDNLGFVLTSAGRFPEAISEFKQAIALDPNDGSSHYFLGDALAKSNQMNPAIAEFQEAVRLDPKNNELRYNLGSILLQQGQNDKAIGQFQEVVRNEPQNPQALFYLGNALVQAGRLREAVAQYQAALQFAPGNRVIQGNLERVQAMLQASPGK